MHVTVYSPFFFMEMTITSILHLDMLQEFVPQLGEDDQEGRIHFQQDGTSLITLKCGSSSAPVSQVGGLVERR
jgi:hypothetical protein